MADDLRCTFHAEGLANFTNSWQASKCPPTLRLRETVGKAPFLKLARSLQSWRQARQSGADTNTKVQGNTTMTTQTTTLRHAFAATTLAFVISLVLLANTVSVPMA